MKPLVLRLGKKWSKYRSRLKKLSLLFNRLLLKEIRRLRDEHEETSRSAAQIAQNPQLLAELKLLRQRKDELELRMSALQESRRELMVQLEGLMNLLKVSCACINCSR